METKPLLYGLIGFFMGGLLVSIAATTFEKPCDKMSETYASQTAEAVKNKQGDEFHKTFLATMIERHEGTIEMAGLSAENARHDAFYF